MACSSRLVGLSTGGIARDDFRTALEILSRLDVRAVELSALRLAELPSLASAMGDLDLARYEYVSVHAPSSYPRDQEPQVVRWLARFLDRGWPVVIHPDAIAVAAHWRPFGNLLLVENMDKRKPTGRTVEDMERIFNDLPDARMCFDIAHARQCDSTMTEAYRLLTGFAARIVEIHISEVSTTSRHARMSAAALQAFSKVWSLVPLHAPVILEAPLEGSSIQLEQQKVLSLDAVPAVTFRPNQPVEPR